MHVCHFCETSVRGEYFRNIAAGLTHKGVKVSLLELGPPDPPGWLHELPNVKYFGLGVKGKAGYPLAVLRLARLLRNEGVDILHTHLFNAGLIAAAAKALYRRTVYVYMRHHTSVVRMLGTSVHVKLDKWIAERADHLLAVSNAGRNYMREVDGISAKIDVVYLGFDLDKFSPNAADRKKIREEFGIADTELVVGYVANFAPGKGHLQLIEAFAKIVQDVPEARLFLVGKGRSDEIADAIDKFGLTDKVVFAGWRDDISACLNAMDIFVQPSLSEAFSQVLVEAMGVELPVVATDVGGANEVIENEENGILILPGEPDTIYSNVLRLFRDPEFSKRIAVAGRRTVLERYTVENMVDSQFGLYKEWAQ